MSVCVCMFPKLWCELKVQPYCPFCRPPLERCTCLVAVTVCVCVYREQLFSSATWGGQGETWTNYSCGPGACGNCGWATWERRREEWQRGGRQPNVRALRFSLLFNFYFTSFSSVSLVFDQFYKRTNPFFSHSFFWHQIWFPKEVFITNLCLDMNLRLTLPAIAIQPATCSTGRSRVSVSCSQNLEQSVKMILNKPKLWQCLGQSWKHSFLAPTEMILSALIFYLNSIFNYFSSLCPLYLFCEALWITMCMNCAIYTYT